MGDEYVYCSWRLSKTNNGGLDGNKKYLSDRCGLRVGRILCGINRCRRTGKIKRQNRY
jgi:hypothetical protein